MLSSPLCPWVLLKMQAWRNRRRRRVWFDPKDDVRRAYVSLRSIDDSFFRLYTLQLEWREAITKKWGTFSVLCCNFMVFFLKRWILCYCDQVLDNCTAIQKDFNQLLVESIGKQLRTCFQGFFPFYYYVFYSRNRRGKPGHLPAWADWQCSKMKIATHIHIDIHPVWSL